MKGPWARVSFNSHSVITDQSYTVLPSGILSLSTDWGRCRTSQLQDYRVQEYRQTSLFPLFKCNVLCEILSDDSHSLLNEVEYTQKRNDAV
jgi:hypothetical protein